MKVKGGGPDAGCLQLSGYCYRDLCLIL